MSNYDKISSFRFSESVYQKLDDLLNYYAEEAKRIGGKPKNKTEIVEEAIKELYFKIINRTQDADVVGRISMTIEDRVNSSTNNIQNKIDQILYLVNKLDLGTKVLYRSPSVLPPPKDTNQAIHIVVDEESGWYNAIEEYMMSKLLPNDKDNKGEK